MTRTRDASLASTGSVSMSFLSGDGIAGSADDQSVTAAGRCEIDARKVLVRRRVVGLIALPPRLFRWLIQRWHIQHIRLLAGPTTVRVGTVPEHVPLAEKAPERMRERPTWLIGRAYARATGLLQEGFARSGDGLRGYHYRLLAALEEGGPASQAALGRSTGIDRSDVTAALVELEARGLVRRGVKDGEHRRPRV